MYVRSYMHTEHTHSHIRIFTHKHIILCKQACMRTATKKHTWTKSFTNTHTVTHIHACKHVYPEILI